MPYSGIPDSLIPKMDRCVTRLMAQGKDKSSAIAICHKSIMEEKMNNFSKFVPINKVDDEKRMVYGFASTPDLDSQGEIVSVEAIKKALPEYLKYPTIREMHQPNAVGVTKETVVDDKKGLYIAAKVVDDNAWKKVKEGVLRGFSIGGSIVSKVGNIIKALELVEISLVDSPANKKAAIELWKAEWSTAYINDLPDSSFAYIEPGGKKDESGKTVPRSLRHFPYKDAEGNIDLPHLRNALARAPQSPFGDKAMPKLRAAAREAGIGEENSGKAILASLTKEQTIMLVKEVIKKMADKLKKEDEVVSETTEVSAETPVVSEEATNEEENAEATETQTEEGGETQEGAEAETVEASAKTEDLIKAVKEAVAEEIAKMTTAKTEVEKVEKVEFAKLEALTALEKRVKALEDLPAASKIKSPAVAVEKSFGTEPTNTSRLDEINKRLAELEKMRIENLEKYQTGGYSREAIKLLDEKAILEG